MRFGVAAVHVIVVFALMGVSLGQQSATAPGTDDLRDRMRRAEKLTALDDSSLRPWHLKMDVQLFDPKGKVSEEGTIEEWWKPGLDRRTYTFPSYTATRLALDGKDYQTKAKGTAPYLFVRLRNQFVHPMSLGGDSVLGTLTMRPQKFGGKSLDCISSNRLIGGKTPPFGLLPTYCFDPGKDSLRIFVSSPWEYLLRNGMGRFMDHDVATDVTIDIDGAKAIHGHVITLESSRASDEELSALTDLEPVLGTPIRTSGGIMAGSIISKVPPIYPQSAKEAHISGTVILHAVISREGKIDSLQVIAAPDAALALAAMDSVRKWVYRPYLLNGNPVEVDTTITVNFALGN